MRSFLVGIAGEKAAIGFSHCGSSAGIQVRCCCPQTQESARGAPHAGTRPRANLNSFFRETGLAEILPLRMTRPRVPVVLSFPAMIFAVPPTVILVPTMLAFGVQIAAATIGLGAVLAMVMNCLVEVCFCLFDSMLALRVVIGAGGRRRGYEQEERPHRYRCHCCFSKSSNQSLSPLFFPLAGNSESHRLANSIGHGMTLRLSGVRRELETFYGSLGMGAIGSILYILYGLSLRGVA